MQDVGTKGHRTWGPTCRFMVAMALVTPFMAWAMELLDLRVWILRDTAWTLALMVMNFFT